MGHTYLRRPLPPEVLDRRQRLRIIRRRQTLDELLALKLNEGSLNRVRRSRSERQQTQAERLLEKLRRRPQSRIPDIS
jgi:hypothetical protein